MAASTAAVQGAVVAPARRHGSTRWPLYLLAAALTLFFILPIYLIAVAAVSPPADISGFPKALYPRHISLDTLVFFLTFPGVVPSMINSVAVALLTLVLSTAIGAPAAVADSGEADVLVGIRAEYIQASHPDGATTEGFDADTL